MWVVPLSLLCEILSVCMWRRNDRCKCVCVFVCVCVCVTEREVERQTDRQRQTRWENDWGEGRQTDKGGVSQRVKMYSGCVIEAMC